MKTAASILVALSLALAGCASARPAGPAVPSTPLVTPTGVTLDARELVAGAKLTVLVFFSPDCHCLDQHDARLRELAAAYRPHGVQLVMVDSEVHATPEADSAQAAQRGYRFPILVDHGARLADAVGAQYATYSVIVDAQGHVLYRGGIDSDKTHLRATSTQYLRDALDDLLAGKQPRVADAKTLGCSLQKW